MSRGTVSGRKNRETNVRSPRRTDIRVVNKVLNKSQMSKTRLSLRMSHFWVLIVTVSLFFLIFNIDVTILLDKLKSILLIKSVNLLFCRLGWCGFGFILFFLGDQPHSFINHMMPGGTGGA